MSRWAWLLLIPWLSGCSLLPGATEPVDREHRHLLDWQPRGPAPAAPPGAPVLAIAPPVAAPGHAGSDMLYSRGDTELHRFAWHRWADAPARLLEPLLVRAAERSGCCRQVVPPGVPAQAELRLDTRLLELQQRFAGDRCEVRLAVRVLLLDNRSGRVIASRLFRYGAPCASPDPVGGARTANLLVARFLEALQGFLASAIPAS